MRYAFSRLIFPLLTFTAIIFFAVWGCSDKSSSPDNSAIPQIEALSSDRGKIGEKIEIYGTEFGRDKGGVYFDTVQAAILSWRDSIVIVEVPQISHNCTLYLVTLNNKKASTDFLLSLGRINSIFPEKIMPGNEIRIYGEGFGETAGTVYFDSEAAEVTLWHDTLIYCTVPQIGSSGKLEIRTGDYVSNEFPYTQGLAENMVITAIDPIRIIPGYVLHIYGSNFGSETGIVKFGMLEAEITSWTDTEIECIVPGINGIGKLVVSTNAFISNQFSFQFGWLEIDSIIPNRAIPGAAMTVSGKYFGHSAGELIVGSAAAEITGWSDTLITFTVPGEAQNGNVRISSSFQSTNYTEFDLFELSVNNIYPAFGSAGTAIQISGAFYGTESLAVFFDDLEAHITDLNDTIITAIVPAIGGPAGVTVRTEFETSEPFQFEYSLMNDIMSLLSQTNAIDISLSSMSRSESCRGVYPYYVCDTSEWAYNTTGLSSSGYDSDTEWGIDSFTLSHHEFTGFPEPTSEYTKLDITGSISSSASELLNISAIFYVNGGTPHYYYDYSKSVTTYNIPLDSVNYQDTIIIFRLTGTELDNNSVRSEGSSSDSFPMDSEYSKLIETDFTDEANPPSVYIKFYKRD